ncbi:uncharacterized protein ACNLHF_002383 isoform 1-T1 [Anomaloglossus baeobatrachus]
MKNLVALLCKNVFFIISIFSSLYRAYDFRNPTWGEKNHKCHFDFDDDSTFRKEVDISGSMNTISKGNGKIHVCEAELKTMKEEIATFKDEVYCCIGEGCNSGNFLFPEEKTTTIKPTTKKPLDSYVYSYRIPLEPYKPPIDYQEIKKKHRRI